MGRTSRMAMIAVALLAAAPPARAQDAAMRDEGRPGNAAVPDGRGGTETQIDDQVFVTKALEASRAQIELAEIALKKTSDAKVRDYAEKSMRDHSAAQAELAKSATREGVEQPTALSARHTAAKLELEQLEGTAFDRRYMTIMVDEAEKNAALFSAKHRTGDGDVAAIANRLTTVMQGHLDMARETSRAVGNADDPRAATR